MTAQVPYRSIPSTFIQHPSGATFNVQNPPGNNLCEKYKKTLAGMGYAELVLGITSIVLGTVAIITSHSGHYYFTIFSDMAQGIWCGAFLIASGILGIKVMPYPNRCMYNANMALSIVTSCAMAVLIIMSSFGVASTYGPPAILHAIMAVLGFAGMVICIVHSAYCCAGVCCNENKYQGVMLCTPHQSFGVQQMIQLPNGQFAVIPPQGIPPLGYPNTAPVIVSPPVGAPAGNLPQMQPIRNEVGNAVLGVYNSSQMNATNPAGNPENPPSYTEFPSRLHTH